MLGSQLLQTRGTAGFLEAMSADGGLPTRNFSRGSFENAEAIGADTLHDTLEKRGGMVSHGCMPGCVIRCSISFAGSDSKKIVSPV